jgi:hypothetical protein
MRVFQASKEVQIDLILHAIVLPDTACEGLRNWDEEADTSPEASVAPPQFHLDLGARYCLVALIVSGFAAFQRFQQNLPTLRLSRYRVSDM